MLKRIAILTLTGALSASQPVAPSVDMNDATVVTVERHTEMTGEEETTIDLDEEVTVDLGSLEF